MENEKKIIFPGSTFGIIGEGPTGIMLARAAKKLGYKVVVYSQSAGNPALLEADVKIVGSLHDKEKLQDFGERCNFVSYESATVDAEVIAFLERFTTIPQGKDVLEITQDRLMERAFYEQLNLNIAPYATIVSLDDVYQAVTSIGYPCVLKPIQKGVGLKQVVIQRESEIAKCADFIDYGTYILESWLPTGKQLAVFVALDSDQNATYFPVVECKYRDQRFHQAQSPTILQDDVLAELKRQCTEILTNIHYVGVMELDFIMTQTGSLYIKNIEPAPGIAGYVFDKATNVTMLEQHLRAMANMPLVKPKLTQPTALVEFRQEDQDALATQWVLKDNWFYNFYRYPASMKRDALGFILVLADTAADASDQIEATGIWDKPEEKKPEENEYLENLRDLGIDPDSH